jgi:methylmalonyl-CoA mutase N-terminal domain/subunit
MNKPINIFESVADLEIKLSRTKTWGGLETASVYGPAEPDQAYNEKIGDPGKFPFTRGAYPQMYRSRMWTLRNIVGYGAPEDTREGIEMVLANGGTGVSIVPDPLTNQSIDPDHPAFGPEVGLEGCSLPSTRDMERLLDGIDLARVDTAWHWTTMAYPLVASVHVKRGQPLESLQGSNMPDELQRTLSGWGEKIVPAKLAHHTCVDAIEFCSRNSPRWALGMPQAYDLRERGMTPIGEIAAGMAIINQTIVDLMARGLTVDDVAPSIAWVSTSDVDFFEEVAKFRALRRFWAKTMKERFGSQDIRAQRLRIACHTSGKSLVYKQPLNNLTRTAIQSFAALCGGVQSLEACTFDEPVCVPSHEARELATRQQQILANEVGAARVADPLGGSWYIEALTDEIEAGAAKLLAHIEEIGLIQAVMNGTIEGIMDENNLAFQRELDSGERIMVGVNRFIPEAEPSPTRFRFDQTNTKKHLQRFSELKQQRDKAPWISSLRSLYDITRAGNNPMQAMIDAFIVDATLGEVWGTVRMAHGHAYDPYGHIESPVDYAR